LIFNGFWRRVNRIYIYIYVCGTWISFEKQNIYIWLEAIRIMKNG
jgi:hypothetical protein